MSQVEVDLTSQVSNPCVRLDTPWNPGIFPAGEKPPLPNCRQICRTWMCYHLSKVFLGIPGCQMWPRNRLEPPVLKCHRTNPTVFLGHTGPLDAPNGSYACPVPPSRVDLLVLANVTPNVSSNVAGKSANEPWRLIVGNIIYKWCMFKCQVWLYRGSTKHMGFRFSDCQVTWKW